MESARQEDWIFGWRASVWRERGSFMVKTFVQVQSDFVNRPSEGDGGVSKEGRDPGREGMSGSGRKGEGIVGGR